MKKNYYEILQVHPGAHPAIIKTAYRTMMSELKMHPDLGGDTGLAQELNEAYDVLSNAEKRRAYDKTLGISQRPAGKPSSPAPQERKQANPKPKPSQAPKQEHPFYSSRPSKSNRASGADADFEIKVSEADPNSRKTPETPEPAKPPAPDAPQSEPFEVRSKGMEILIGVLGGLVRFASWLLQTAISFAGWLVIMITISAGAVLALGSLIALVEVSLQWVSPAFRHLDWEVSFLIPGSILAHCINNIPLYWLVCLVRLAASILLAIGLPMLMVSIDDFSNNMHKWVLKKTKAW